MVWWTPPIGTYMWSRYLGLLALWMILRLSFDLFMLGWTGLAYMVVIYAVFAVLIYVFINWSLGDVYHHEMSTWKMKEDQVLRRLAQAMVARGARPPLERRGKRVWFLLPPLSIVVRSRWLRTSVFVGPSTEETEFTVERLKGFVERALG